MLFFIWLFRACVKCELNLAWKFAPNVQNPADGRCSATESA